MGRAARARRRRPGPRAHASGRPCRGGVDGRRHVRSLVRGRLPTERRAARGGRRARSSRSGAPRGPRRASVGPRATGGGRGRRSLPVASPPVPSSWPNAQCHPALADADARPWTERFLRPERVFFPTHVGLVVDEVRAGYARLRLPARAEVAQAAGVVHGGALATLIDTAAIPAVATSYPRQPELLTVSLTVNYLGVVAGQDAVAEAWVEQAGRSMAFVRAEVRSADQSQLAAVASLVFKVRLAPEG
ncbi:MAG: hotdog fold thioesterase [Acidimicrobiia bacterium]|nr:hotdog fold thioesterase [Acidimicrobiia bacterium]